MKKLTKYFFLFFIPLAFLFQQCKKDDGIQSSVDYRPNTVWGKVIDKTTGQGIAHARVYFLTGTRVILGNPSWHTTSTQYSDSSGNFSFTTTPSSDSIYQVYSTKDLYFDDGNNATLIAYTEVGYSKNVPLQPMAWMKLHVKNVNPYDNADEIDFGSPWGGGAGPFYGKNLDTILLTVPMFGNDKNNVAFHITKNNITKFTDTLVIPPSFDTTLINIFY